MVRGRSGAHGGDESPALRVVRALHEQLLAPTTRSRCSVKLRMRLGKTPVSMSYR